MRTAIFLTERQMDLLETLLEAEIKEFKDKYVFLCQEYQDLKDHIAKRGVEEHKGVLDDG